MEILTPTPETSPITTISLKDADKFVEITEDSKTYYGGDQNWFSSHEGKDGGCGTVAAANITAYMAKQEAEFSKLYPYSDYSKNRFVSQMNDLYQYLHPYTIPILHQPFGIWPVEKFERGFEAFCKSRGVDLQGVQDKAKYSKENVTNYIMRGLQADAPVAMMMGFNNLLHHIEVVQPNGKWWVQKSFATHWVVITGITIDEITHKTTLKVSTWGGHANLDLDKYMEGERLYECLIWFKQKE